MLHKFMLQVWQHMFFIYFFYKFSFFSKNLFQQQQKIFRSIWNLFLRKKCCATKEKYLGTHIRNSWNSNILKNLLQFHEKVARVPKALSWAHFNNEPRVQEKEQVKDQPHIDFCSLSNNSKYQLGAPDVTTVFPTWAYGRFKEIQSNFRRKKLHRTN